MANTNDLWNVGQRKARYGHRVWILWRDRVGQEHLDLATADSLKAAMLAHGTQGSFTAFSSSDGVPMMMRWPVALCFWKNAKAGYLR